MRHRPFYLAFSALSVSTTRRSVATMSKPSFTITYVSSLRIFQKLLSEGVPTRRLRLNANARFVSPALYNHCIHRVATETGAIRNTKQLPTVSVRYFLVVILRQIARTSTRFVSVSRPTWVVPKSMCGLAVKETCFESMLPIV